MIFALDRAISLVDAEATVTAIRLNSSNSRDGASMKISPVPDENLTAALPLVEYQTVVCAIEPPVSR